MNLDQQLMLQPGCAEEDIDKLYQSGSFRSTVYMYANNKLTLGEAMKAFRLSEKSILAQEFINDPATFARLFHECARRLKTRDFHAASSEASLVKEISALKSERTAILEKTDSRNYYFYELEDPRKYYVFLAPKRDSFTEDDISFFLSSELATACFDAYSGGIINRYNF